MTNDLLVKTTRGRDTYRQFLPFIRLFSAVMRRVPGPLKRRLIEYRYSSDSRWARLVRFVALRSVAEDCGDMVDVHRHCDLLRPDRLRIGSRVSVHPKCYIDATGGISIGNDVSIAHQATILSTTHTWEQPGLPVRDQPVVSRRTVIEDDVWIGAGVRVMAGVRIGTRSIVGAGAVVTTDVPARSIVAGVPARVIREI